MLLACGVALAASLHAAAPKYVFMFIGDGMGMPQRMVAEDFSRRTGRGPLAMNALPYQGLTRTASANQLITDSAAAATASAVISADPSTERKTRFFGVYTIFPSVTCDIRRRR